MLSMFAAHKQTAVFISTHKMQVVSSFSYNETLSLMHDLSEVYTYHIVAAL